MRPRSVAAGVALLVAAACAPGGSLEVVTFETATPGVGDAALLEGAVVDEGGCLGVELQG